ncbi:hypothetical protein JW911_01665 [Candidatus Peregrinibacteria bacterium]|nr:hypothetical protein [Candidatus Peregrinibacteria bacterium]
MMFFKRKTILDTLFYFAKSLSVVIGLVMIWRGIWYVLDFVDFTWLGGNHIFTAIGGIIAGLAILYIPNKNLHEIEKL